MRERVANGGDPTKLREPPVVDDISIDEQGIYFTLFFSIKVSRQISLVGVKP